MINPLKERALSKGAIWRKWDLHIHTPGTRLNDQYKIQGKTVKSPEMKYEIWQKFCKIIHDSDVQAFGITDYFTFESYYEFIDQYKKHYPECGKVFFPNLELRLSQSLNKSGKHVNLHILFPDTLTEKQAEKFLQKLETNQSSSAGSNSLSLYDVLQEKPDDLASCSVELKSCIEAVKNTFEGIFDQNIFDAAFFIVSGKDDGISPGSYSASNVAAKPRNHALIDEIDQRIHGVFARSKDRDHWLNAQSRSASAGKILLPHPTFSGCDAHCFDDLQNCLGKNYEGADRCSETTWVKAVPSWSGLLQTLAEPENRVRIQELSPDQKKDYLVIDTIHFNDNGHFPGCISFNPGLNAIIGSRSSGKSSLLAHIAYAISPEKTVEAQKESGLSNLGPAAGLSWDTVEEDFCVVNWRGGTKDGGGMVYVPQNYLTQLNAKPHLLKEYIIPAIEVSNSSLYLSLEASKLEHAEISNEIERLTGDWFNELRQCKKYEQELANLPNKATLQEEINKINQKIDSLRAVADLSDSHYATHTNVSNQLENLAEATDRYDLVYKSASTLLRPELDTSSALFQENLINLDVRFGELENHLPSGEMAEIRAVVDASRKRLQQELTDKLLAIIERSKQGSEACANETSKLLTKHAQLFERVEKNTALNFENKELQAVEAKVKKIEGWVKKKDGSHRKLAEIEKHISQHIKARTELEEKAVRLFNTDARPFEDRIKFNLEVGFSKDTLESASEWFDKKFNSPYLQDDKSSLNHEKTHGEVEKFLDGVANSQVKFKKGLDPEVIAKAILKLAPEFRFSAEMDGDRIGGFNQSTMTPGKQALFALTLILSDAGDEWPLLIDQPEDDLDSKSIFTEIVEFLKIQKNRRQIIMVTHNANLVVGADAELVIVANRHGDDRPNEAERTFDYFSGALEDSGTNPHALFDLDKLGIREHVVEILDGGEEAFIKRRQKYKL